MELAQLGSFGALRERESVSALLSLNRLTAPHGLVLAEAQALALTQSRDASLRQAARLEFGGSALPKLVLTFSDSPYLPGEDPVALLGALTDLFYEYKNETLDALTDDELLAVMKDAFDGPCHGSTELLSGLHLDALARRLRGGGGDGAEEDSDDPWN